MAARPMNEVLGVIVGGLVAVALIKGWALMVALGILGVSVGYWESCVASVLLTVAVGMNASVNTSKS